MKTYANRRNTEKINKQDYWICPALDGMSV